VADAIAAEMVRFADARIGAETCLFGLDGSDDIEAVVTEALDRRPWEVVVVGGGVRKAEDRLELFERVINLVHRHASGAAIAFNSTPGEEGGRYLSATEKTQALSSAGLPANPETH